MEQAEKIQEERERLSKKLINEFKDPKIMKGRRRKGFHTGVVDALAYRAVYLVETSGKYEGIKKAYPYFSLDVDESQADSFYQSLAEEVFSTLFPRIKKDPKDLGYSIDFLINRNLD